MTTPLRDRLLTVADEHLAREGAAALSLRAVARDLGVVPSALYRHVDGRDGLLTLLIVEAYGDLGRTVVAAESAISRDDLRGRWEAVATSLREWAIAHPHRWGLLYGTPVVGYAAPAEETNEPGTAVIGLLARLLGDITTARSEGRATSLPSVSAHAPDPSGGLFAPSLLEELDLPDAPAAAIDAETVADGLLLWDLLIGAISSEVFAQPGPDFRSPETFFAHVVRRGAQFLGLNH